MYIVKILCSILLFWGLSFSTFASNFLADTSQYIKINSDIESTTYMDISSTEVVRYEPPFYIIRGTVFRENYSNGDISSLTCTFFYDYDSQNVKYTYKKVAKYNEGGMETYSKEIQDSTPKNLPEYSTLGMAANFFFFKNYNILFYKDSLE